MPTKHRPSAALLGVVLVLGLALARAPASDFWRITVVDGPGVGPHTSLAILPAGGPAIGYYDRDNGDLKYAWRDGATWHATTVDSTGDVGGYTSLAVLPSGQPAISYFDFTNYALKYAWFDGTDWHIITVDDGDAGTWSAGRYGSLVILPTGQPAISYCARNRLMYASFDGAVWNLTMVAPHAAATSLAVLPSGQPAIAYSDHWDYALKYAWYDGVTWHSARVDGNASVLRWLSLAILPSGHPAICYRDYKTLDPYDSLKYAWFDGVRWLVEEVDPYGGDVRYATHISLGVQPSGHQAAVYRWGSGWVQYIWYDDYYDLWRGGGGWYGTAPSLAFRPSGKPSISYFDETNGELRYAFAVDTGDLNCDGVINAYDIDPFICALSPNCDYAAEYPDCDKSLADCNGDGVVNAYDIDGFIALLGGK
ncbi:MAG: dockerin type I domain-containing protein [Planctomycetota bacterium]